MLGRTILLPDEDDEDCWRGANDVSGERGLKGAGGGSMGEARPSRMAFLSASTSDMTGSCSFSSSDFSTLDDRGYSSVLTGKGLVLDLRSICSFRPPVTDGAKAPWLKE